jgi:hypothetical protein
MFVIPFDFGFPVLPATGCVGRIGPPEASFEDIRSTEPTKPLALQYKPQQPKNRL